MTPPEPNQRRFWLQRVIGMLAGGTLLAAGGAPSRAHAGARMVPTPAPAFRLPVEGRPGEFQTLEALSGKVILLNFWATWCVPCRREFPALSTIAAQFAAQGLVVLGVNTEDAGADAEVAAFLATVRPGFMVLRDRDMAVARACNVQGMPATFIADRQGRLRWQHGGYQPGEESQYVTQIQRLLAESA